MHISQVMTQRKENNYYIASILMNNNTARGIITNNTATGIITNKTATGIITNKTARGIITNNTATGINTNNTATGIITNNTVRGIITNNTGRGASGSEDLVALQLSKMGMTADSRSGFRAYTRTDVFTTIEKALKAHYQSQMTAGAGTSLDMKLSPGQELFFAPGGAKEKVQLPIREGGHINPADLAAKKVRPYFNPFALISTKPALVTRLGQLGYQLMKKENSRPESFTIVHLLAGQEQLFASVTLAVDADLQPWSAKADPRLGTAKRSAVKQILGAVTLGEVLPGPASLRVNFRALSLQVCILSSVAEPKLFIFGSGSDFDHNFGSGSSYSSITVVLY